MIFRIVDSRYWAGLPMIITTNLTKQDLLSPRSVTKKRIYDCILDRCCPIEMTGTNLRVKAMRTQEACGAATDVQNGLHVSSGVSGVQTGPKKKHRKGSRREADSP